jgi:hypothetical protein
VNEVYNLVRCPLKGEAMEFNYRLIKYACDCGTKPLTFLGVGTSSLGELVVVWFCTECNCQVMCRSPLERLIADIPPAPETEQKLLAPPTYTVEDTKMLAEMHITLGDTP